MIVGVHSPRRIRLSASWGLGWGGRRQCPSPSSSAPYGPRQTAAKTQTPPGCGGRSASRCWRICPAEWKCSVRKTAVRTVFLPDIIRGRIVLVLFFKNKPTLLLLCCVALLTSTPKVTQSLSSSFSRTNRSGSCERRIRRRLAIFRSMSVEDTRGFLKRKRLQVNLLVWGLSSAAQRAFSGFTWAAVLSTSPHPRLWEGEEEREAEAALLMQSVQVCAGKTRVNAEDWWPCWCPLLAGKSCRSLSPPVVLCLLREQWLEISYDFQWQNSLSNLGFMLMGPW